MEDISNKKFNYLTVISFDNTTKKWICSCDCGATKKATLTDLKRGKNKGVWHCGDKTKHHSKTQEELNKTAANYVWHKYKTSATVRNIEFKIKKEHLLQLMQMNCILCGTKPSKTYKTKSGGCFRYNGVDRIDNSKGYIKGNVQTMCYKCNIAKANMTELEFDSWIENIYKNLCLKKHNFYNGNFKKFHLYRSEDVSGTSGIGVIAEGVIFPKDGKVVLEWKSGFDSITIFGSIEEMMMIHSHDGRTKIIYD